ncbi:hypothetical protein FRC19_001509 [Serendipita sp. 401]|nr:hypothetical protein FRC19_001509 [Serendipita sp. 401]
MGGAILTNEASDQSLVPLPIETFVWASLRNHPCLSPKWWAMATCTILDPTPTAFWYFPVRTPGMSDTLVRTADISTITSATRSTLHFNSNQVPNDTMLKYLSSEIRNRQMELNQLLSKKAICEEEIKMHAEVVKREDSTLIVAQGGVEFHSSYVDYLCSRPTAPSSVLEGNSNSGTDQPTSGCTTYAFDSQISDSTREFDTLLQNEMQKLSIVKEIRQEGCVQLEGPKAQLMVRERRIEHLDRLMVTLNAEIRELMRLRRPQLQIPDEVWIKIFSVARDDEFEMFANAGDISPTTSRPCGNSFPFDSTDIGRLVGFHGSMSRPLSPTETNYVNVETLDIRRTNFNLVILEPPPNFDLRELSHQMGFNSFERVTIFGNQYNRSTGDVVLPDTHEFFLCDFFLSSNIVAPGTTHVLYLHTAFSGQNIDASPYMLSSLRELTLCGDSIDLPDNNENEISLPELVSLCVSPIQLGVLKRLTAPRLTTLILDPPDRYSDVFKGDWSSALLRVSSRCSFIKFDTWRRPIFDTSLPPYWSAAAVCLEIVKGSQNLIAVEFLDSIVDGERLVMGLGGVIGPGLGTTVLNEMIFNRCTGITRMNCEALMEIVGCLRIMV